MKKDVKNLAEFFRRAADAPIDPRKELEAFNPETINLPPDHVVRALWGDRLPVSLSLKNGYSCYYYAGEKFTLTKLKFTLANLSDIQVFAWDKHDERDRETEANFWRVIAKLVNPFGKGEAIAKLVNPFVPDYYKGQIGEGVA
mgnify:CR=1 FL=1|tara:strand:- start:329 stop:757 length:429 start_codon:yes stop_codon:yes gene_type:complete